MNACACENMDVVKGRSDMDGTSTVPYLPITVKNVLSKLSMLTHLLLMVQALIVILQVLNALLPAQALGGSLALVHALHRV